MKKMLNIFAALFLVFAAIGCSHDLDIKLISVDAPNVVVKAYPGVNYVTWAPVANAQGYKLYRYDSSATEGAKFLGWFDSDDYNGFWSDLGYADAVFEGDPSASLAPNLLKDGVEYTYYVIATSGRWFNEPDAAEGAGTYVSTDALVGEGVGSASVKANIPAIYSIVDAPENVTIGIEGDLVVARFDAKPYLNYKVMLTVPGTDDVVQAIVKNNLYNQSENAFASAATFTPVIGEYQVSILSYFETEYYQANYKTYADAKIKVEASSYINSAWYSYNNSSHMYEPDSDRGKLEKRSFVVEGNQIKYLFRFGRFDDLLEDGYEGVDKFTYTIYRSVEGKALEQFSPELTTGYSGDICYSYFYDTFDISKGITYYYLIIKDEFGKILPVQIDFVRPHNDANSVAIDNFAANVVELDGDGEEDDVRITWNTTDPGVVWSLKFGNEDDIATVFNDTANVIDVSDIQPYVYTYTTTGGDTYTKYYYTKLVRNITQSDNKYVFILSGTKEEKNSNQITTTATYAKDSDIPVVDLKATKEGEDVVISWGPADIDVKRNFKYTLYRAAYVTNSTSTTTLSDKTITSEYTLVASTDAAIVGESNALKADALGNFVVRDENLPGDNYTYVILAENAKGLYPAGKADIKVNGTAAPTLNLNFSVGDVINDGKFERILTWNKLPEDSVYDVYTIYRAKANVTFPATGNPVLNGLLSQYEVIACSADENTAIEEEYSVNNVSTTNWATTKVTYNTTMKFEDTTASTVYDYVYYVVATSTTMPSTTPFDDNDFSENYRLGTTTVGNPSYSLNPDNIFNIKWNAPTRSGVYLPVEYKLYYQTYSDPNRKDLKDDAWKAISIPAPVNGEYIVVADLTQHFGKRIAFNLMYSDCFGTEKSYRWVWTSAPFTSTAPTANSINGYAVEYGKLDDANGTKVVAVTLYGKGFNSSNLMLNVAECTTTSGAQLKEQFSVVGLKELTREKGTYPTTADDGYATGEEIVTYYWEVPAKYIDEGNSIYVRCEFTLYGYEDGYDNTPTEISFVVDTDTDFGTTITQTK